MVKRLRWTTLGYVAGLGTSYVVARRMRRVLHHFAPPEVARRSGERVRQAVAEGRSAMRQREAQLHREFGERPRLRTVER